MDGLLSRRGLVVVVAALAVCATSCSRHDQKLQDHYESLASISASVKRIGEAWLDGETSGTYTLNALEQMFRSTEQERAALASTVSLVADPRGASIADAATELSRRVAQMILAIRSADGHAIRQQINALPFPPAS